MKLFVPPLNISEDDGFLPAIDLFERKSFGVSLLNLINTSGGNLVLALDTPWGEGKTTFVKMWRGLLKQEQIPNIYFDAFENDYLADPFLAISSQIYKLIDKNNAGELTNFKTKATAALKVIARAGIRIGVKTATAGILDETVFESVETNDDASEEVSDLIDSFISNQISRAEEDRKSLTSFRLYLEKLGEKLGSDKQVVIIIDELDRCKPKYALSIIESIKHLFSVPNIVFVLVMNREQIEESIRCEYGQRVNAEKYLQKFIGIWATLPKSNNNFAPNPVKYINYSLNQMGFEKKNAHEGAIGLLGELAIYYSLSLREIEQSLTNFAIVYNATQGNLNSDYSYMTSFFSIIKVIKPNIYKKVANDTISFDEMISELNLHQLTMDGWEYNNKKYHPLVLMLKCCLSESEAPAILNTQNPFESRFNANRNMLSHIQKYLDAFQR